MKQLIKKFNQFPTGVKHLLGSSILLALYIVVCLVMNCVTI